MLALGLIILQGCQTVSNSRFSNYKTNFGITNNLLDDIKALNNNFRYDNQDQEDFFNANKSLSEYSDYVICLRSKWIDGYFKYQNEAKRRGLDCSIDDIRNTTVASKNKSIKFSSNISFVSTDGNFSLRFDVDNEIIKFKPLANANASKNFKYYKMILNNYELKKKISNTL